MHIDERDSAEVIRFSRGERIFGQGEPGDATYLLETGRVTIHQVIDGRPLDLDGIEPGEIFGEMAVLDGGRRMATATAAEDSVVLRLPASAFQRKLVLADRFLRALVMMVIKNIRTSHRVFLRRPRSFRDHVRQMNALSGNVRRFAARLPDPDVADALGDTLGRLDAALAELGSLAQRCPDQRHDIVLDHAETDGVGLDEVVGSESRRKVYVPPRPQD